MAAITICSDFGAPKIKSATVSPSICHEVRDLGRKVMTNLDSILKSRDIALPTKVHLVKAMVFPVVMYGYESRTIKKAEHRRIDAFELWCWRRLLRVPWTARRSNKSILREISPWCSLEELMLKLKLQYFGHLMQRADSLKKTLMLGKIEGRKKGDDRGWDGWMASSTRWTWVWIDSVSWWWTGKSGMLQFMRSQSETWLRDWTELKEKEMATHSNILAWRIPGIEEPGGLPSMGLHRVRHNWSDLAAATAAEVKEKNCLWPSQNCLISLIFKLITYFLIRLILYKVGNSYNQVEDRLCAWGGTRLWGYRL